MIKVKDIKKEDVERARKIPEEKYPIIIEKIKSDNLFLLEFILKLRKLLRSKNKDAARGFLNISCQILDVLKYIPLVSQDDYEWAINGYRAKSSNSETIGQYQQKYYHIFALIIGYLDVATEEKIINEKEKIDLFCSLFWLLRLIDKADQHTS